MAVVTVTTDLDQTAGVPYTVITDSSSDWGSVSNSVYFFDKATKLTYYKNSSGTVVSLFEEGGGSDTFVTGGTYSGSTIILNRNDGNSVDVTGITSSSIYTADGTLTGDRTVSSNGNDLIFDSSYSYIAEPFKFESYPYGGAGTNPYLKIKGYGEVEILGRLNDLFTVKNGSGVTVFDVNNGNALLNGTFTIASSYFKVATTTKAMNFYQNGGTNLLHDIQTGIGFPDKVRFNMLGGTNQFIVGAAALIGTETISLQGSTLITEKLELSTTTDGFLMPRLTTAQKNAISSPDTNLMVFDTDLSSLQRYNGTAWVAMAAGYGIIEVIRDSDNGNPTFYSDLQSALETCKTAGSSNTINIYSNITITSTININRGGSGVGNGYQYKNLTIDFNGFTLTNNEADSSYCFDVSFGNVASENRQITFKNGIVNRTSGTGAHYTLHCYETENDGRLLMDNMRWYCENSNTIRLKIDALDDNINSFGGSQFISDGGYTLYSVGYNSQNFNCLGSSSVSALIVIGSRLINFTTRNASTGIALQLGGGAEVSHFDSKSGEGVGVYCTDDFQGVANNFYVETTTGDGIETRGTNQNYKLKITNFEVRCGDGFAIANGHRNSIFSNYLVSNNSATKQTIIGGATTTHSNGTAVNYGSGRAVKDANPSSLVYNNMTFISKGGIACEAYSDNAANNVFFYSCLFDSQWNDVGGHALIIGLSAGSAIFSNCNFKVSNASANCINATASRAISVSNSNFNGSTTPINSNITLNHLESDAFGNVTT